MKEKLCEFTVHHRLCARVMSGSESLIFKDNGCGETKSTEQSTIEPANKQVNKSSLNLLQLFSNVDRRLLILILLCPFAAFPRDIFREQRKANWKKQPKSIWIQLFNSIECFLEVIVRGILFFESIFLSFSIFWFLPIGWKWRAKVASAERNKFKCRYSRWTRQTLR